MRASNAKTTIIFLSKTSKAARDMILNNIANHYGISRDEAFDEVTRDDAEYLLDYVTGPERAAVQVLMQRRGLT